MSSYLSKLALSMCIFAHSGFRKPFKGVGFAD